MITRVRLAGCLLAVLCLSCVAGYNISSIPVSVSTVGEDGGRLVQSFSVLSASGQAIFVYYDSFSQYYRVSPCSNNARPCMNIHDTATDLGVNYMGRVNEHRHFVKTGQADGITYFVYPSFDQDMLPVVNIQRCLTTSCTELSEAVQFTVGSSHPEHIIDLDATLSKDNRFVVFVLSSDYTTYSGQVIACSDLTCSQNNTQSLDVSSECKDEVAIAHVVAAAEGIVLGCYNKGSGNLVTKACEYSNCTDNPNNSWDSRLTATPYFKVNPIVREWGTGGWVYSDPENAQYHVCYSQNCTLPTPTTVTTDGSATAMLDIVPYGTNEFAVLYHLSTAGGFCQIHWCNTTKCDSQNSKEVSGTWHNRCDYSVYNMEYQITVNPTSGDVALYQWDLDTGKVDAGWCNVTACEQASNNTLEGNQKDVDTRVGTKYAAAATPDGNTLLVYENYAKDGIWARKCADVQCTTWSEPFGVYSVSGTIGGDLNLYVINETDALLAFCIGGNAQLMKSMRNATVPYSQWTTAAQVSVQCTDAVVGQTSYGLSFLWSNTDSSITLYEQMLNPSSFALEGTAMEVATGGSEYYPFQKGGSVIDKTNPVQLIYKEGEIRSKVCTGVDGNCTKGIATQITFANGPNAQRIGEVMKVSSNGTSMARGTVLARVESGSDAAVRKLRVVRYNPLDPVTSQDDRTRAFGENPFAEERQRIDITDMNDVLSFGLAARRYMHVSRGRAESVVVGGWCYDCQTPDLSFMQCGPDHINTTDPVRVVRQLCTTGCSHTYSNNTLVISRDPSTNLLRVAYWDHFNSTSTTSTQCNNAFTPSACQLDASGLLCVTSPAISELVAASSRVWVVVASVVMAIFISVRGLRW